MNEWTLPNTPASTQESADRAYSGYALSPLLSGTSQNPYQISSVGSVDNKKLESPGTTTGSLSVASIKSVPSSKSSNSLGSNAMPSSPSPVLPPNTAGKRLPVYLARNSSLVRRQSIHRSRPTGNMYGPPPSPVIYPRSLPTSVLCLTGNLNS